MKTSNPSKSFTCKDCGQAFTLPEAVLDKYPGWTPGKCPRCHSTTKSPADAAADAPVHPSPTQTERMELEPYIQRRLDQVLQRYCAGPQDGVFTDGGCSGNPGPGGWGAVYVRNNKIVGQRHGREGHTTNNRMELMALIAGYKMLEEDAKVTVWTDSQLCVNTFNTWAPQWEKRGWRRKSGPIKNLDLVQELYALVKSHPRAELRWLKAHAGSRWNEYVDTLATGHLKE